MDCTRSTRSLSAVRSRHGGVEADSVCAASKPRMATGPEALDGEAWAAPWLDGAEFALWAMRGGLLKAARGTFEADLAARLAKDDRRRLRTRRGAQQETPDDAQAK